MEADPLDPSKTKIPVLGISSERSDIAMTSREPNCHHAFLKVMLTFRIEMQVSEGAGGRRSSTEDFFCRFK